jgi:hypothetical protein
VAAHRPAQLDRRRPRRRGDRDHRARHLGEQRGQRIDARRHAEVERGARRERHLEQRHEQAAVGAIVVRAGSARSAWITATKRRSAAGSSTSGA